MVIGGVFASFLVFKCVMFITMCMCSSQPPSSGSSACCFHKICINHAHAMQITSPLTYLVFLQSAYYHRGRLGINCQMLLPPCFFFFFAMKMLLPLRTTGVSIIVFTMFFFLLVIKRFSLLGVAYKRKKDKSDSHLVPWISVDTWCLVGWIDPLIILIIFF